ncbi:hypothetical protein Bca101_026814 [Brassica carinata]
MLVVGEKNLHLILNIPMDVYGDQKRIQQLIAEFLLIIVHYEPTEGSVELNLHRKQRALGFITDKESARHVPQ